MRLLTMGKPYLVSRLLARSISWPAIFMIRVLILPRASSGEPRRQSRRSRPRVTALISRFWDWIIRLVSKTSSGLTGMDMGNLSFRRRHYSNMRAAFWKFRFGASP